MNSMSERTDSEELRRSGFWAPRGAGGEVLVQEHHTYLPDISVTNRTHV